MTIAELKAVLAGLPDDHLVILARDSEGNTISPLASTGPCRYTPMCAWGGEVNFPESKGGKVKINAICLWPVR